MRKFLIFIMLLLFPYIAQGQMIAEFNHIYRTNADDIVQKPPIKGDGFQAGLLYGIRASNYPEFSLRTGLLIDVIDYWHDDGDITLYSRTPFYASYTKNPKENLGLTISMGPSLVWRLHGNAQRLETFFGFRAGVVFKRYFQITGGYERSIENNVVCFGIGYIFE